MHAPSHVERLLRVGLAFALFYPAVSAWFTPFSWIGYFPPFLLDLVGSYDMWMLHAFGAVEILIALWLLFGRRVTIPATLASIMLVGIVAFNANQMDVIFRDISILAMAVALIFMERAQQGAGASTSTQSDTA